MANPMSFTNTFWCKIKKLVFLNTSRSCTRRFPNFINRKWIRENYRFKYKGSWNFRYYIFKRYIYTSTCFFCVSFDNNYFKKNLFQGLMVLPPCTDQGTSHYQWLVIPFNYRSLETNCILLIIMHFFQIIALIFWWIWFISILGKCYGNSLRLQIN